MTGCGGTIRGASRSSAKGVGILSCSFRAARRFADGAITGLKTTLAPSGTCRTLLRHGGVLGVPPVLPVPEEARFVGGKTRKRMSVREASWFQSRIRDGGRPVWRPSQSST